jgi:hypothetical protein
MVALARALRRSARPRNLRRIAEHASRHIFPRPSPQLTRQLGSQTLYVLFGNLFTLSVGLPLQILVARVIGTAELGVSGLIDGAVSTANGFLGFGIAPTMVRFIPAICSGASTARCAVCCVSARPFC